MSLSIDIKGLTVSYDRKTALANIFLSLKPGFIYGLLGPNGAGKSTLVKAILGLLETDGGVITFSGQPVKAIRKKMAYIPQKSDVDWQFPATVWDVVLMGRYPFKSIFSFINKYDEKMAAEALGKVGMLEYKDKQIGELSGGQQQRVFLARALCQQAEIYLLDEPLVGVDITTEDQVMKILKQLAEQGKTIIVIHHDLSKVEQYFDNVILLNQRLVATGKTSEVFTKENVERTYSSRLTIFQEMDQYKN